MVNPMSIADQLAYSTVRISCTKKDGKNSVGTGFLFDFAFEKNSTAPVIVTNRHVVEGALVGDFLLTEAAKDGTPSRENFMPIRLDAFESFWLKHPSRDVDLCAMPIAPLIREAQRAGKQLFYRTLAENLVAKRDFLAELSPLDEVVMVGYPVGIWDSSNNQPVFRKGVAATAPEIDYQGRKEFMIDIACFPGSSGSPVLVFNVGGYSTKSGNIHLGGMRLKLLGVLYAGPQMSVEGKIQVLPIPTTTKAISMSSIPVNLGLVIKAERILEFRQILEEIASRAKGE